MERCRQGRIVAARQPSCLIEQVSNWATLYLQRTAGGQPAAISQEEDLHSDISLIFNWRAGGCLPCLLRAAVCNYCANEAAHDDTLPNVPHSPSPAHLLTSWYTPHTTPGLQHASGHCCVGTNIMQCSMWELVIIQPTTNTRDSRTTR